MNSLIASIAIVEEDTNDDVSLVWVFPGISEETRKVLFFFPYEKKKKERYILTLKKKLREFVFA